MIVHTISETTVNSQEEINMAIFNGKNNITSLKRLFNERATYLGYSFLDSSDTTQRRQGVANINIFERVFNGRVDPSMNTIFAKPELIRYGSFSGLNFAVDAMQGFIDDFHASLAALADAEQAHPYLSRINVYRSYQPPENTYNQYATTLMQNLIETIKTNNDNNSIQDFKGFVNYFLNFLKNQRPYSPFTKTRWHMSQNSNIFTTGLAFAIADLPCDDDAPKGNLFSFTNTINLDAYVQTAMNHGFSISLHCPWIMIFNPLSTSYRVVGSASQGVEGYLAKNGVLNSSAVYTNSFNKVYKQDIDNLKNKLINYYNKLINLFPYYRIISNRGNKTISKIHYRTEIDQDNFNAFYSDKDLHLLYARIRNIEENDFFDEAGMDILEQKINFFYNNLDRQRTLSYINDQFRNSYITKSGGINDYLSKTNNIIQ